MTMRSDSPWAVVWEFEIYDDGETTDRLRVPGGWIYRTKWNGRVAMVFVPALPKRGKKLGNLEVGG